MSTAEQLDPRLLAILACPQDKGPLLYFADEQVLLQPPPVAHLSCVREGIPVMLIDEATAVDPPRRPA